MARWRIVQVKPLGLSNAFVIESYIDIPATKIVNSRYKANQSYWEGTFRLNAAGRPRDYFIDVPAKQEWRELSSWHSRDTLAQAIEAVEQLQIEAKLVDKLKTFKRTVIQEYD